jgi:hypothetical protein
MATMTLIALASVFPFACDKPGVTERQKEDKASEEARNAAQEAQRQVQAAQQTAEKSISAARTDFETTRENYLHRRRLELVDLDSKIFDLQSSARTSTGNARADIHKRLSTIRAQRDAFVRHLQDLETATASTWDGAAAGLDREWESLKGAVEGGGESRSEPRAN